MAHSILALTALWRESVRVPAHKAGSLIIFHQGLLERCQLMTTGQPVFPLPAALEIRLGDFA
jgi:hypothetical protein